MTVFGNNKAREYLESFGITDTEARLMYDVKQSRLVFLVKTPHGGGAVGRALSHSDTHLSGISMAHLRFRLLWEPINI